MTESQVRDLNAVEVGREIFGAQVSFGVKPMETAAGVTLLFQIIGRSYSKTVSFADYLVPGRLERAWAELFLQFDKDFPTGNVPVDTNIPEEDDMSVEEKKTAVMTAIDALIEEVKAEKGSFVQADIDAAKQAGIDEAVAADTTKFSDADLAKQKEEMQAEFDTILSEYKTASSEKIKGLELQISQKDADTLEETVADDFAQMAAAMMKKAEELRARTVKSAPVEETPVEETPAPVEPKA
jgi:hypothetical protein